MLLAPFSFPRLTASDNRFYHSPCRRRKELDWRQKNYVGFGRGRLSSNLEPAMQRQKQDCTLRVARRPGVGHNLNIEKREFGMEGGSVFYRAGAVSDHVNDLVRYLLDCMYASAAGHLVCE